MSFDMNMPPLPYLKRIRGLADWISNARVWERFKPGLMSLSSPDPQAFRLEEEAANVLHVGLPTNFKANETHNQLPRELEADVEAVKLDGQDIPVKFVPLTKWSLPGNYRCITPEESAVHPRRSAPMDRIQSPV